MSCVNYTPVEKYVGTLSTSPMPSPVLGLGIIFYPKVKSKKGILVCVFTLLTEAVLLVRYI